MLTAWDTWNLSLCDVTSELLTTTVCLGTKTCTNDKKRYKPLKAQSTSFYWEVLVMSVQAPIKQDFYLVAILSHRENWCTKKLLVIYTKSINAA